MCMQQNCIKLNNKNQNELVTSKKMNENNKPIFIRWKVGLLVIRDASFTISGPYSCLRIVRTSWNSISTSQSFKPESIFVSFKLQLESIFVWLCLTFPIRLFFLFCLICIEILILVFNVSSFSDKKLSSQCAKHPTLSHHHEAVLHRQGIPWA